MKIDWSRFKNYGLWLSLFSLIGILLNAFGVNFVPEEYTQITNAILAVLIAAGIISNPTTEAKGYLDDKKAEEEKRKAEEAESRAGKAIERNYRLIVNILSGRTYEEAADMLGISIEDVKEAEAAIKAIDK